MIIDSTLLTQLTSLPGKAIIAFKVKDKDIYFVGFTENSLHWIFRHLDEIKLETHRYTDLSHYYKTVGLDIVILDDLTHMKYNGLLFRALCTQRIESLRRTGSHVLNKATLIDFKAVIKDVCNVSGIRAEVYLTTLNTKLFVKEFKTRHEAEDFINDNDIISLLKTVIM